MFRRSLRTFGEWVWTTIPWVASRVQLVCTRGIPSTSTMHTRQAPAGCTAHSSAHSEGMWMPAWRAAFRTVSPGLKSTVRPLIVMLMVLPYKATRTASCRQTVWHAPQPMQRSATM